MEVYSCNNNFKMNSYNKYNIIERCSKVIAYESEFKLTSKKISTDFFV